MSRLARLNNKYKNSKEAAREAYARKRYYAYDKYKYYRRRY